MYTLNFKKMEGVRVKYTYLWVTDGLKHSEMIENQHHRSLFSTTRLPWHREDP